VTPRGKQSASPTRRRTQEERSSATVHKLVDAATEALIDVGYAEASVQAICTRAGLSQGALFRHFPTREALMVATGEYVADKTLTGFRAGFESLRGSEPAPVLAMRLIRMHSRSRLNQAWYELLVAARTREPLRQALAPAASRYFDGIVELGRELFPELAGGLGAQFSLVIKTVVAIFDGENMQRFVQDETALDEARLGMMGQFASLLLPDPPQPTRKPRARRSRSRA